MSGDEQIIRHYTQGDLAISLIAALNAAGKDVNALRQDDLAGFDDLHVGGKAATAHLVDKLGIEPGMRVADLGSGIGGTGRYIAQRYDAHVMGIDLSPEYSGVANMLSNKVGLRDKVAFETGTALSTPFADKHFDAVCTIHAAMNIRDKAGLYLEAARILRPFGVIGVYDILKGEEEGEISYPQPWSQTGEHSFLAGIEEMKELLAKAGFSIVSIEDRRGFALASLYRLRQAIGDMEQGGPPPGIAVLLGADAGVKIANLIAALESRRCAPVEIVARHS
jgi:ubiquinone/menaquinone biosynthesis C-methylase UbiE